MKKLQTRYNRVVEDNVAWQNAFDSIPDMICILDKDARIVRVNRSFRARLNMPGKELVGSYCHEVLHAARIPPPACPFKTALETGQPVRLAESMEIGDALFDVSLIPLPGPAGDPEGAVHIFHDITEQKRRGESLIQAEKMAAIGRLAAEIAHEINNPLLYISNYLYLLSEELPPDFGKREYFDKIQGGVDNLTALTRDLLEFSRPPLDALSLVDIHGILDASLQLMETGLSEKRIKLVRRYGCGSYVVHGSGKKLQQTFVNLIQNALDALEQGGSIIISTSCSADLISLKFEDTGAGITAENLRRIFDPFFTTKKSPPKKGSGLGLAVCYNIVKRHQGEITVASKEGKGTTFTIVLPAASQKSQ